MATNASTWFYNEPEHNAYLIEERVNHTFWGNRISALYLDCVQAEPPFRMEGVWREMPVALEWVPNDYLALTALPGDDTRALVAGVQEIMGFVPAVSYRDNAGRLITEWHAKADTDRVRVVQGNPNFHDVKLNKPKK